MSRPISFTVPDAESEAAFLLAVFQRAIKAYRNVHPTSQPSRTPRTEEGPTEPPYISIHQLHNC